MTDNLPRILWVSPPRSSDTLVDGAVGALLNDRETVFDLDDFIDKYNGHLWNAANTHPDFTLINDILRFHVNALVGDPMAEADYMFDDKD
jgi:hypothetical protein